MNENKYNYAFNIILPVIQLNYILKTQQMLNTPKIKLKRAA